MITSVKSKIILLHYVVLVYIGDRPLFMFYDANAMQVTVFSCDSLSPPHSA